MRALIARMASLGLAAATQSLTTDRAMIHSAWNLYRESWVVIQTDSNQEKSLHIRVSIVSNVRLHRDGLAALLRECPSIEVLGATSVQETQYAPPAAATDVALVDLLSPGDSEIVRVLRKIRAGMRVVALGVRECSSEVLTCAAAGMDGYVPMDAALGDMVTAIENAVRGELACSPKVASSLYHCIGFKDFSKTVTANTNPLTLRELQVADLINRGCPTKEIAWRLGVQPCTAKNHVRNILQKLQVGRRGQAVAKLRTLIGERFSSG
jgi:two-component system nitrate/nitrite response regulator NarL